MFRAYRLAVLLSLLLVAPASTQTANPPAAPPLQAEELTLEKLFPKEGLFGPAAHGMAFSHDGKYAAYLHRPYKDRKNGPDLWLLEIATGKASRVTSQELMARYQSTARKANNRDHFYSGISEFTWSPVAHELLFTSEGDVYRWKVGNPEPLRLTLLRAQSSQVRYFPDGKGYTCLRDRALMRLVFGSELAEQIDPTLPQDESLQSYKISPDGKYLALVTQKYASAPGADRKVAIASYRDRFMKVNEVPRHVSEDPLPPHEWKVYLHEVNPPMIEDGEPTLAFTHKATGPRDLLTPLDWSPDSKRIAFGAFDQATSEVRILTAEIAGPPKKEEGGAVLGPIVGAVKSAFDAKKGEKKVVAAPAKVVHRYLHTGGPNTPGMTQPRFLDDSRRLVLLSEQSGFRHLYVLEPLYDQFEQVTFGRCEVYPVALSKDRKHYYVTATREHPACRDVYRVTLADRKMERLTTGQGVYEEVVVAPDGSCLLANVARFGSPRELACVRLGPSTPTEKVLTDSHPEGTKKLITARPEFITYQNRHGHDIQGFLFKPSTWSPGDKRPLLIYVYGGPLGTSKMVVEGNYQADAYLFARYMTEKHGYVTCTIDPRGMSGYGGVFEKANFEQVGKPQVEDLVDGVKYLVADAGVDPKRVGIHGWSFGGFQTQMCMYTAPETFAVGIAGAGPTEWENYNSWYSTATIGPSKPGQPDLSKFSLLPLAKNLKGQLLLVHGMEDPNVLYQDTVRVYRELLKAGKETQVELFLDPTGGHGLLGDVDNKAKARKYEEFLLRHLGKGTPKAMEVVGTP
jgi:dipeptidyl aminopeptidase/acylaminoacyl peptidase